MYILFNTVDYSDKYALHFSNPKTWGMWAIIDLHDYLMFFLINVFIIVACFIFACLQIQQKRLFINFKKLEIVKSIEEKYPVLNQYCKAKLEELNHAPWLEFFWTLLPTFILFMMGWPSFKVLYAMEQLIDPFHTIIIVGNQWYWTYQYSDFDIALEIVLQFEKYKEFSKFKKKMLKSMNLESTLVIFAEVEKYIKDVEFLQLLCKQIRTFEESKIIYDSVIIPDESLPLGYPRLLSVDQVLVLPANVSVRLLITSSDVIHSWALPSHGLKMDAIPGRINQISFIGHFWGTYWGQCSELCGINHGFMPIEVIILPFHIYLDYIKLNIAFRFDKFIPIVQTYFLAYVHYLEYAAEKNKFCSIIEIINTAEKNI